MKKKKVTQLVKSLYAKLSYKMYKHFVKLFNKIEKSIIFRFFCILLKNKLFKLYLLFYFIVFYFSLY